MQYTFLRSVTSACQKHFLASGRQAAHRKIGKKVDSWNQVCSLIDFWFAAVGGIPIIFVFVFIIKRFYLVLCRETGSLTIIFVLWRLFVLIFEDLLFIRNNTIICWRQCWEWIFRLCGLVWRFKEISWPGFFWFFMWCFVNLLMSMLFPAILSEPVLALISCLPGNLACINIIFLISNMDDNGEQWLLTLF